MAALVAQVLIALAMEQEQIVWAEAVELAVGLALKMTTISISALMPQNLSRSSQQALSSCFCAQHLEATTREVCLLDIDARILIWKSEHPQESLAVLPFVHHYLDTKDSLPVEAPTSQTQGID